MKKIICNTKHFSTKFILPVLHPTTPTKCFPLKFGDMPC